MSYVIRQEICSCCHLCELQCPAQALRMKNRKYWIDPEKCISCGICARNCHNGAIYDENAEPEEAPKHEKITRSCDVLVIGGGASGLVAAAKAADLGRSVIVLEKNWETGGSAYFAHMMRAHYSKWHREKGLEDPRPAMYDTFVEKTEGRCNNALVKRCLDADSEVIDWLIDKGELQKGFKLGTNHMGMPDLEETFTSDLDAVRSDPSIGPGTSGWYICRLLTDLIGREGGEILYRTQAVSLLTENGRVAGALARDPGGEVEVRADAVIVAAGTYSRNREIMNRMQPCFYENFEENPVHIFACSTCTGDGITMCEKIGADIDYENKRAVIFGPVHHPYSYGVMAVTRFAEASTALVDRDGNFIDQRESDHGDEIGLLSRYPGRIGWSIIGKDAWDEAVECAKKSADRDDRMAMNHFDRDLGNELRDGSVVYAESLDELADRMHMNREALHEAVRRQNELIVNAPPMPEPDPDDFMAQMMASRPKGRVFQDGPCYAVFEGCFQENAIGGMEIDEKTRVLSGGKPIPGLYACGDNTRGIMLSGKIGVAYIESVLSAITYAMCSGYVAAEEASAYSGEK